MKNKLFLRIALAIILMPLHFSSLAIELFSFSYDGDKGLKTKIMGKDIYDEEAIKKMEHKTATVQKEIEQTKKCTRKKVLDLLLQLRLDECS